MSWYGVAIYAPGEPTWRELFDTLNEAARYLGDQCDDSLWAVEYNGDGKPTKIVLRRESEPMTGTGPAR